MDERLLVDENESLDGYSYPEKKTQDLIRDLKKANTDKKEYAFLRKIK